MQVIFFEQVKETFKAFLSHTFVQPFNFTNLKGMENVIFVMDHKKNTPSNIFVMEHKKTILPVTRHYGLSTLAF